MSTDLSEENIRRAFDHFEQYVDAPLKVQTGQYILPADLWNQLGRPTTAHELYAAVGLLPPPPRGGPMKGLLRSRKFWISIVAVIGVIVLDGFGLDPELWEAIKTVAIVLIGSIAVEDAAAKLGGNKPPIS